MKTLDQRIEKFMQLRDAVLSVCVILPDDTPEKPNMIYGHPTREEWFNICMLARETKQ